MTVFISHSFENKPEFENIVDALTAADVPYWNPSEVKSGSSLRDQLRQAVEQCSVCIFVATHHATKSSWCGAELGAFWGSGKPVIVYLAEPSLTEEELPPILQGDVWERRIMRVVSRAKELISEHQDDRLGSSKVGRAQVASMTSDQLQQLMIGAVLLAAAQSKAEGQPKSTDSIAQSMKGAANTFLEGIRATQRSASEDPDGGRKRILWVDDRPDNNRFERGTFEAMGISFSLARSTQEALAILSRERFAAVISDMGREEGPEEGYVLLDAIRATDRQTPFFIYAGSNAQKHKRQALQRGAQGSTNSPQELLDMVVQALQNQHTN